MSKTDPEELRALVEWSRTVIRFISEKARDPEMAQSFERDLSRAQAARDIRGLRTAPKDLREWVRMLVPGDRLKLEQILASSGYDEDAAKKMRTVEIGKILQRGFTRDEDEHRLLLERVDEIFQDDSKKDEVDAINRVLTRENSK